MLVMSLFVEMFRLFSMHDNFLAHLHSIYRGTSFVFFPMVLVLVSNISCAILDSRQGEAKDEKCGG